MDQVNTAELNGYAAIAFGCPAMGSEVLEEMEFQPMFDACKNCLGGKAVALFGSYGWGDGEWMRSWEKDCADAGAEPGLRQRDLLRGPGRCRAGIPPGHGQDPGILNALHLLRRRLRRRGQTLLPLLAALSAAAVVYR